MGRTGREGFPGAGLGARLPGQMLKGLSYFLFSILKIHENLMTGKVKKSSFM